MSIIYKAQRVGRNGRIFTLYKLKTMKDAPGPTSTSLSDPRISILGRFFRKYKVDELPQILNVLRGNMGLIGWRPEDPKYLDTIHPEVLKTKPGITGLASVWDYNEEERLKDSIDPDADYEKYILPKKRELEYTYVKNKSFILNLRIAAATICPTMRRLLMKHASRYWI